MEVCMYMDRLMNWGYISEEDWDAVSMRFDNSICVDVPENILREYYNEKVKECYNNMPFEKWYSEESICDDFDDLIGFDGWHPSLTDVKYWPEMLAEAKWYGEIK